MRQKNRKKSDRELHPGKYSFRLVSFTVKALRFTARDRILFSIANIYKKNK